MRDVGGKIRAIFYRDFFAYWYSCTGIYYTDTINTYQESSNELMFELRVISDSILKKYQFEKYKSLRCVK